MFWLIWVLLGLLYLIVNAIITLTWLPDMTGTKGFKALKIIGLLLFGLPFIIVLVFSIMAVMVIEHERKS